MKTHVELPERLMIEIENLAAQEQRQVSELMAELVRAGLELRRQPEARDKNGKPDAQWLEDWFELADTLMTDSPDGPSARILLDEERNRLERR